jgi:hypothetical protein
MIKHHIREEEKPGGMSAEARKAKMDLVALGAQLATRKTEIEAESERGWAHVPRKKALDSTVLITPRSVSITRAPAVPAAEKAVDAARFRTPRSGAS